MNGRLGDMDVIGRLGGSLRHTACAAADMSATVDMSAGGGMGRSGLGGGASGLGGTGRSGG